MRAQTTETIALYSNINYLISIHILVPKGALWNLSDTTICQFIRRSVHQTTPDLSYTAGCAYISFLSDILLEVVLVIFL